MALHNSLYFASVDDNETVDCFSPLHDIALDPIVRVGLVSPPSGIKTLYAFQSRCPAPSTQLHSARGMHNLMEKVRIVISPSCLTPTSSGLLSVITKVHDSQRLVLYRSKIIVLCLGLGIHQFGL